MADPGGGRHIRWVATAHSSRQFSASVPAGSAAAIRAMTLRGQLKPWASLWEGLLSRRLPAGPPTIREALLLLERWELVRRAPRPGTFVVQLEIPADSHLRIAEPPGRGPTEARAAVKSSVRRFLSRHFASRLDGLLPGRAGI